MYEQSVAKTAPTIPILKKYKKIVLKIIFKNRPLVISFNKIN